MFDTVNDTVILITENNVAVFAHNLYDQPLMAQIPKLIQVFNFKFIFVILPLAICFRSSIQKFGAVIGLGLFSVVR